MHIVIINASPYNDKASQTAKIVNAFQKGILEKGETAEIFSLCSRSQWQETLQTVITNDNIVFAVPVYVGMLPSMLKEFLEKINDLLPDENRNEKRISFILQSAFPEATQRHCCEKLLKSFVDHLRCNFSGILSHSIFYGFIDNISDDLLETYSSFGKKYVINNATFFFQEAIDFNGVEYLTEQQAKNFVRGYNFLHKHYAEAQGGADNLYNNPYDK